MEEGMRNWKCRNCGRSNRTEVAVDGTAACGYCGDVTRIQPSRARGFETAAQLSLTGRRERRIDGPSDESNG